MDIIGYGKTLLANIIQFCKIISKIWEYRIISDSRATFYLILNIF